MPRGLFGSEHSVTYYYTLDTFNWPSIQCAHPPVPGRAARAPTSSRSTSATPANANDNFLIDPNLKPIRTREFTLGIDHELNRTISLGVRYARKRFDRTIEDTGVLVPGIGEVFRITNPGEGIGENVLRDFAGCTDLPEPAEADAQLRRRRVPAAQAAQRQLVADQHSYLYSRLYGNYSGLTSSDENNRNAPSVNRFFDGQYNSFDRCGKPVFGLLQTDRPHVFKVAGHLRSAVGHGPRPLLAGRERHAAADADEREGHSVLPVRPRRSRPDADADPHRPVAPARLHGWIGHSASRSG